MQRLNVTSFENGILEWAAHGVHAFIVEVNGEKVGYGSNGLGVNALDISRYDGELDVYIAAVDGGAELNFTINAEHTELSMPGVDCSVRNGVLVWNAVPGAAGYRIVDLKRGATTQPNTSYDMNFRNLVFGVCALSPCKKIKDGRLRDIRYLDGDGTEASPYLIRTSFELRAVDYYETLYAEKLRSDINAPRFHYEIQNDIDYESVATLEGESNLSTVSAPFYGVLDGKHKALCGISVDYDGGYWALFDFIARGGEVKDITVKRAEIINRLQQPDRPLDAAVATVADRNYGTISGINVSDAKYTSAGGAVCGICSHNHGVIRDCTVSGEFAQALVGLKCQACYEMAGIVTENCAGGTVEHCAVLSLRIRGSLAEDEAGLHYGNVRTAGGIVAVNRAGGRMFDNMFGTVTLTNVAGGGEFGGLCAYNAGLVSVDDPLNLGTLKINGRAVAKNAGGAGLAVGKNDAVLTERGDRRV